jgi:hypothetical protein
VPNRTSLIFTDNPGDLPAQYVVPPSMDLQLQSVVARFNGSGAGAAFWPCLSVFTSDDHLVGRFRPSTQMEAGDSGVVTYAPFLKDDVSAGGCTVLTRVFNTKDNEDGGNGFLWNGGAGDLTFVPDAASPTGEACNCAGVYADLPTMLASPTNDAYVIEVAGMTPPGPVVFGPPAVHYRFTASILVRGTDAATTYTLVAAYGENLSPAGTYIGRGANTDPFVYDDAWHRAGENSYSIDDTVIRAWRGTAYTELAVHCGGFPSDPWPPPGNGRLFLSGFRSAGAGSLRIVRVTFSWIATDF